jgi:hypothetical protein
MELEPEGWDPSRIRDAAKAGWSGLFASLDPIDGGDPEESPSAVDSRLPT